MERIWKLTRVQTHVPMYTCTYPCIEVCTQAQRYETCTKVRTHAERHVPMYRGTLPCRKVRFHVQRYKTCTEVRTQAQMYETCTEVYTHAEVRTHVIIIKMYIYHALINALNAHMIHINLNMIFYTHVEHSPTKTIYIKY